MGPEPTARHGARTFKKKSKQVRSQLSELSLREKYTPLNLIQEQIVASTIKRAEHSEFRGVGEGNSNVTGGIPKGGQQGRFEVRLRQGS